MGKAHGVQLYMYGLQFKNTCFSCPRGERYKPYLVAVEQTLHLFLVTVTQSNCAGVCNAICKSAFTHAHTCLFLGFLLSETFHIQQLSNASANGKD